MEHSIDPNWYPPFKQVDFTVVHRISEELEALKNDQLTEGKSSNVFLIATQTDSNFQLQQAWSALLPKPSAVTAVPRSCTI